MIVMVLGKYMIIGYLDPQGLVVKDCMRPTESASH